MSFNIIIPTLGKPTLRNTLSSLECQLSDNDRVTLVGDGPQPDADKVALEFGVDYLECPVSRDAGFIRNYTMPLIKEDYLLFMDDDDIYLPGALDTIRKKIQQNPGRPLVFKMVLPDRHIIWRTPRVKFGNVSTQMIVVPNIPEKLGKWGKIRGTDFAFLQSTEKLYPPNSIVWCDEIICFCRPDQ